MKGGYNKKEEQVTNCSDQIKHGDYSTLSDAYSKYRPGYSENVLSAILGLVDKPPKNIRFVDIGAGTGKWTRLVAKRGCMTTAVEPNDEMRSYGISDNKDLDIAWLKGCAEDTGLEDSQVELVTMASSFHWTDFEVATKEIRRILTPGGWFVALWNQRLIEENPLLIEIEQHLKKLVPNLKRVSSGKSDFCNTLTDRFIKCGRFNDVVYMEGRHIERMTADRYVGIWRSVNDVRVQAGQERFEEFIDFIKARLRNADYIDATYLTRAWAAKRPV